MLVRPSLVPGKRSVYLVRPNLSPASEVKMLSLHQNKKCQLYALLLMTSLLGSFSSFLIGCWSANASQITTTNQKEVSDAKALLIASSFFCFLGAALLFTTSVYILVLMSRLLKGIKEKNWFDSFSPELAVLFCNVTCPK